MTLLYSHHGAYPAALPFRIVLSSGRTRTDPASFTVAEIADAGYVEAPAKPEHDPATQHEPEWTGEGWAVTDLTPEEIAGRIAAGQAALIEAYRLAIQSHVDQVAQSRRYDGGNSLASYVASTNAQWAAEAVAFVAWRDAVWTYSYAELDKVLAEEREQPTIEDFLGELPVIEWPEA